MRTSVTFLSLILALCCASESYAVELCTSESVHIENPCDENVTSPFIEITPEPTGEPSAAPTEFPTISPTIAPTANPTSLPSANPTSSPTVNPTPPPTSIPTLSPSANPTTSPSANPTVAPTGNPSSAPTDTPSVTPTGSPTDSPTSSECETQNGVYGSIDTETVRTLEFGYEVEATADADTIEDEVLPLVEKSVTDSILGEIFTECTTARRQLRVSRRLEITGVTQNPEDVVLDDVVCGEVGDGNECVVVNGAFSIYATTEESASALEEDILSSIRSKMEAGDFNDVDPSVVRVTYTDLDTDRPDGSQSNAGNNPTVGNNNTPVLVGALVAAGVLMAVVLTVAYRRRTKGESEDATATELGQQPTLSS